VSDTDPTRLSEESYSLTPSMRGLREFFDRELATLLTAMSH
jgi:hypothetical protein